MGPIRNGVRAPGVTNIMQQQVQELGTASLIRSIVAALQAEPDRIAFVFVGGGVDIPIRAQILLERLTLHAKELRARGVSIGDVVLLALDAGEDLIALFLGAMYANAVPCI